MNSTALIRSIAGELGRSTQRFKSASTRMFVAARSAFESGEVTQALVDGIALLSGALLVVATGLGVAFAFFILLCVRC